MDLVILGLRPHARSPCRTSTCILPSLRRDRSFRQPTYYRAYSEGVPYCYSFLSQNLPLDPFYGHEEIAKLRSRAPADRPVRRSRGECEANLYHSLVVRRDYSYRRPTHYREHSSVTCYCCSPFLQNPQVNTDNGHEGIAKLCFRARTVVVTASPVAQRIVVRTALSFVVIAAYFLSPTAAGGLVLSSRGDCKAELLHSLAVRRDRSCCQPMHSRQYSDVVRH